MPRRDFGQVRQLPSGRWQARWRMAGVWHTARRESDGGPLTFTTRRKAADYLAAVRRDIEAGRWQPQPKPGTVTVPPTLRAYTDAWLAERDLKPRTRAHYRALLDKHILPTFGDVLVTSITPTAVRQWYARMGTRDRPTVRAHAYALLRTVMNTAVADDLIPANPCRVRGGGSAKRVKMIRPATLAELEALVAAMPERYRTMTLLAAWCGLRFGELAELRRPDVDLRNGVLHVRRAVIATRATGVVVGTPKSHAGVRDVGIPPHLLPTVKAHVRSLAGDALVFPGRNGQHMAPSSLFKVFKPAREAAGRPDLRWHDLRHTGAVLAAATGATLAELMARLGHSTPGAAMRYQHASADRDRVITHALSKLATDNVTPIRRTTTTRKRKEGTA
jgi:integrase